MNAKQLVIFCISVFFVIKFIILPITTIIGPASKIKKIKNINKLMGEIIISFPQKNIYSNKFKIFVYLFFGLLVVITILFKSWIYGVFSIVYFSAILTFFVTYKYSKINGLYENGLVINDTYLWSNLHSWKAINNDKISILKKNGMRFDLETNNKKELIKEILIKNGIIQEL